MLVVNMLLLIYVSVFHEVMAINFVQICTLLHAFSCIYLKVGDVGLIFR